MQLIRKTIIALVRCWRGIHLIDKCLLVIMAILLLQSACSLFIGASGNEGATQIDAVLRTSAAGIFGYFISANFRASEKQKTVCAVGAEQQDAPTSTPSARAQIGFGAPTSEVSTGVATTTVDTSTRTAPCRTQILVVAGIGVVSLLILIAARDIASTSPGLPAMLSQLRDFVSGSVGFLVGTPTGNER